MIKITIDKAVLEQAIDALVQNYSDIIYDGAGTHRAKAFEDDIKSLREALTQPQPVQANEWQPIETAPKDGTEILLSNGETVAQGNWLQAEPCIKEKRDLEGRYIDQDEFDGYDGWIDSVGGMQPDPTHWMPLPHPPSEQAHGITKAEQ